MPGRGSSPRTILSNVGWLTLSEVVGRGLTFVALVHLTRTLGPGPMGMVEFGLSVFALLSLISVGGIEIVAARQVARTTAGVGRIAGVALILGWGSLAGGLLVLAVFAPSFDHEAPALAVAAGFALASLVTPLTLRFAFLGRERMDLLAVASVLGQVTWTIAVFGWIRSADDVQLAPALWLAGECVRAAVLLTAYSRIFGRIRRPRWRALKVWVATTVPVTLGRVSRGALYVVDVFILGLFAPLAVVGLYGVALRLPLFAVSVGVMAHHALFPSVARMVPAGNEAGLGALQGVAVRAAVSLGLAATLTLAGSADAFLGTLFGEPYRAAATFMVVLVWRIPLTALSGLYRNVVWASRPGLEARLSMLGSAVTVTAAIAATLVFGPLGCAWAMVGGEATLLALYLWGARGHAYGLGSWVRVWLPRQALALAGIALWSWWMPSHGDPVIMASAVAVGAAAGVFPLLPWLPELRAALRR